MSPAPSLRADLAALEERIRQVGADRPRPLRVFAEWLLALVLGVSGLALVYNGALPLLLRAAALLVSTLGFVALGTIGHTASHGGFSRSAAGNQLLFYLSYPLLLMLSARYWRHSHVHVHHAAPNVVGIDDDCDLRPLFALNAQHREGAGAWHRYQGLLLPLVLPFNGFNIQRQGWQRLLQELADPNLRTRAAWADLACMCLHVALFVALPMAFLPPSTVLAVYCARVSVIGVVLFAVLAPGHYPVEAACLDASQRTAGDFWLRQTAATIDFRTGPVGRWLCAGLQYQIEHHLFPGLSHVHYPAVSEAVRELCKKHGLPHRTLGWGEALWKSYRVFFFPKPVVADVNTLRLSDRSAPSAMRAAEAARAQTGGDRAAR
jgi:fatty acid desaturase